MFTRTENDLSVEGQKKTEKEENQTDNEIPKHENDIFC